MLSVAEHAALTGKWNEWWVWPGWVLAIVDTLVLLLTRQTQTCRHSALAGLNIPRCDGPHMRRAHKRADSHAAKPRMFVAHSTTTTQRTSRIQAIGCGCKSRLSIFEIAEPVGSLRHCAIHVQVGRPEAVASTGSTQRNSRNSFGRRGGIKADEKLLNRLAWR